MDGLVKAYFNGVHNCEVVQECFEHLDKTRYRIVGEAVDTDKIKKTIAKGAKEASNPNMSRGDVENMRKEQRGRIRAMSNEELLHEMPFQIYGPPLHGPSDAEKVPIGKPYVSRKRATSRANKLDQDIGGYRYQVRRVPEEPVNEENIDEATRPGQIVRGYNRASLPKMTDRRIEASGSAFRSPSSKNKMAKTNTTAANAQAYYWKTSLNNEEVEYILDLLVVEGYTNSYESAACILEAMSDEWLGVIIEKLSKADQRIIDNRILSKHADELEQEISKLTSGNTQPAPGKTRPRKKLTYEVK